MMERKDLYLLIVKLFINGLGFLHFYFFFLKENCIVICFFNLVGIN